MSASSAWNTPAAATPASSPSKVSISTVPPPGAPRPGWWPKRTVGTSTVSTPKAASAATCEPPPTRPAATKLERIRVRAAAAPRSWRAITRADRTKQPDRLGALLLQPDIADVSQTDHGHDRQHGDVGRNKAVPMRPDDKPQSQHSDLEQAGLPPGERERLEYVHLN